MTEEKLIDGRFYWIKENGSWEPARYQGSNEWEVLGLDYDVTVKAENVGLEIDRGVSCYD